MIVVARQKIMINDWFFIKGVVTVAKFTWSSIYIFQKTVLEMLLYLSSAYCIYWSTCNGHIDCLNVPLDVEHTAIDYISHWDLDHLPWLLEGSIILVEPDSYLKPWLNIEPLYFLKSFNSGLLNMFFLLELYQLGKCQNPTACDFAALEIRVNIAINFDCATI